MFFPSPREVAKPPAKRKQGRDVGLMSPAALPSSNP
jgi:hypothetical protein